MMHGQTKINSPVGLRKGAEREIDTKGTDMNILRQLISECA